MNNVGPSPSSLSMIAQILRLVCLVISTKHDASNIDPGASVRCATLDCRKRGGEQRMLLKIGYGGSRRSKFRYSFMQFFLFALENNSGHKVSPQPDTPIQQKLINVTPQPHRIISDKDETHRQPDQCLPLPLFLTVGMERRSK